MDFEKSLAEQLKIAKDKRSNFKIVRQNYWQLVQFQEKGYNYKELTEILNGLGLKIKKNSLRTYMCIIKNQQKKKGIKNVDTKTDEIIDNDNQEDVGDSSSNVEAQETGFSSSDKGDKLISLESIKNHVEKPEKIHEKNEQTNRTSKGVESEKDKENSSQGNVTSTEEKLAKMVEDSGWYEEAYSYDLSSLSEEEREVAEYIYCGIPYTADGEPCVDGNVGISQKVSDKVLKYQNKYNK